MKNVTLAPGKSVPIEVENIFHFRRPFWNIISVKRLTVQEEKEEDGSGGDAVVI